MQVPNKGGELELWDFGIKTKKEYLKLAEGSYGIKKSKLPKPKLIIKPKIGEIILFNPQNLHCIAKSSNKRITASCFIGYRGNKYPLTYWS